MECVSSNNTSHQLQGDNLSPTSQPEPPVKDREEKGRISRRKGTKSRRKIDILIATSRGHPRRPVAVRPGHSPQTLLNRIQSVGPCDLTKTKAHCSPLFCHCSQHPPHKLSCGHLSIYRYIYMIYVLRLDPFSPVPNMKMMT